MDSSPHTNSPHPSLLCLSALSQGLSLIPLELAPANSSPEVLGILAPSVQWWINIPVYPMHGAQSKMHSTWDQQNWASFAHDGNLLISLPLIGFLSFSVSFIPPCHLCFLGSLLNKPRLRPCMHKSLQHHVAILCPLWKQLPAEVKVKELYPHSLHLDYLDLWKCPMHSFQ